jgi:hypothetical protein
MWIVTEHRHYVVGHTLKGNEIWRDLGSAWIAHRNRRTYREIALIPDGSCPPGVFNLWRGFEVDPKPGSWGMLELHLREVICSGNEDHYCWLRGWIAYCVQNPGKQAEVAVVLRGLKGTGKGMLGRMLMRIFRNHSLHITNSKHLVGNFNAHLVDALFLFLDEAFWAGDKQGEGILKPLITEPTIMIEPKGIDSFQMPNRLAILMASNNDWVVPASADERRYFVLDVSDRRKGDVDYFRKLSDAIEGEELAAMLHDLLALDLSGWNHRAAPHTAALNHQKLVGADSLQKFWIGCLTLGRIANAPTGDDWPDSVVCHVLHAAYLVLQLSFGTSETSPVVEGLGNGPVCPPPERPSQDDGRPRRCAGEFERGHQVAELGHAEGDEYLADDGTPPFAAFSPARSAARRARASMARVTCRCQPRQLRTSWSARSTSCLAASKHSSTSQRRPATRARSTRRAVAGPNTTK